MLTRQYASPESKTGGEWAGREQVGCGSHPGRGRVEDAESADETSVLQVHDQSRQRCVLGAGLQEGHPAQPQDGGWCHVPRRGKNGRRREPGGKKTNLPVCLTVLLTPAL